MRLKTYFVDTVEEAMLRARGEFGEDAMLVHSKRASAETEHLGRYEVVFAAPQASKASPAPPPPVVAEPAAPVRKPPARSELPAIDRLRDLDPGANQSKIRRELKALSRMMDAPPTEELCRSEEIRSTLDELYGYLAEREVRTKHIEEITKSLGLRMIRGAALHGLHTPQTLLQEALVHPLPPPVDRGAERQRIIALIGPPGAGKTTTLAKLAVREGLACGRPVHVLDLDNQRIGGGDHLQTICGLLGVSYQQVYGAEMVPEILSSTRSEGLILIDTPGLTVEDSTELAVMGLGLGEYLTMERHLVLPATLRNPEMIRYWTAYRRCQPTHLLFTRLDESLCFGPVWSLAAETELPAAWMTTGRKIPECIIEASPQLFANLVHRGFSPLQANTTTRPAQEQAHRAGAQTYSGNQESQRSYATL
jgi:flagellar biosynthesis protein FlhF